MSDLKTALNEAVKNGLLNDGQVKPLSAFFASKGLISDDRQKVESISDDLSSSKEYDDLSGVAGSEAPRLIRGFHDILISIGVIAAVLGLWGLIGFKAGLSSLVVMIVCWGLAEYLVKIQRLAFPAFVLTQLFLVAATVLSSYLFEGKLADGSFAAVMFVGFIFVALIPFYWRFKIPVALASMLISLVGLLFVATLALLDAQYDLNSLANNGFYILAMIGLAFALLLFAIAMRFDLKDPLRVTRRSDVAFWLHLSAAPALFYGLTALLFSGSKFSDNIFSMNDASHAYGIVGIVIIMMLIGIIIDRRAFVTAGLISLGVAIFAIAKEANIDMKQLATLPLLMIGVMVLVLGSQWKRIRAFIVQAIPDHLAAKLPPAD